jgi:hypothetical protein
MIGFIKKIVQILKSYIWLRAISPNKFQRKKGQIVEKKYCKCCGKTYWSRIK